jgi:hypothetical protein
VIKFLGKTFKDTFGDATMFIQVSSLIMDTLFEGIQALGNFLEVVLKESFKLATDFFFATFGSRLRDEAREFIDGITEGLGSTFRKMGGRILELLPGLAAIPGVGHIAMDPLRAIADTFKDIGVGLSRVVTRDQRRDLPRFQATGQILGGIHKAGGFRPEEQESIVKHLEGSFDRSFTKFERSKIFQVFLESISSTESLNKAMWAFRDTMQREGIGATPRHFKSLIELFSAPGFFEGAVSAEPGAGRLKGLDKEIRILADRFRAAENLIEGVKNVGPTVKEAFATFKDRMRTLMTDFIRRGGDITGPDFTALEEKMRQIEEETRFTIEKDIRARIENTNAVKENTNTQKGKGKGKGVLGPIERTLYKAVRPRDMFAQFKHLQRMYPRATVTRVGTVPSGRGVRHILRVDIPKAEEQLKKVRSEAAEGEVKKEEKVDKQAEEQKRTNELLTEQNSKMDDLVVATKELGKKGRVTTIGELERDLGPTLFYDNPDVATMN